MKNKLGMQLLSAALVIALAFSPLSPVLVLAAPQQGNRSSVQNGRVSAALGAKLSPEPAPNPGPTPEADPSGDALIERGGGYRGMAEGDTNRALSIATAAPARALDAPPETHESEPPTPSMAAAPQKPFLLLSAAWALAALFLAAKGLYQCKKKEQKPNNVASKCCKHKRLLVLAAAAGALLTFLLTTGWEGYALANPSTMFVMVFAVSVACLTQGKKSK